MLGRHGPALALLFVAVGCASPDPVDDDEAAFDAVPDVPSTAACNGRLHCFARIQTPTGIHADATTPQGLAPADLIDAYHVSTTRTTTRAIAVVDAFDYPNAESDLAKYRSQFGLPACTTANGCFKKVNQAGQASPLPGRAPAGDDWTVEAALDLDMASAACPTCKLILVEAQDDQGDGLYRANDGAVVAGAAVVSNSWGGVEDGTEASLETHFNHTGVGYFASSGDAGFDEGGQGPSYPATSALVTAVGGTTLVQSSNTRGWSEKAWSDGGSNCSIAIARPSFQPAISACSKRYGSDVSAVGDPNTGVAVFNKDSGGFIVVGGTSASSPFVAGVMALYGLHLKGPGYSYGHASFFFDVKSGRNGTCTNLLCKAQVGYDGPTGNGTPNGAKL